MAASSAAAMPSLNRRRSRRRAPRSMPMRSMNVCVRSLYFAFSLIPLHEAAGDAHHLLLAGHRAQHVAFAYVRSGSPADIDFPAIVADRHGADVLHHRLGAVARTSRRRQLQLARTVDSAETWLRSSSPAPCCRRDRSGNSRCRCSSCRCGSSCPRPSRPACRGRPTCRADPASRHADQVDALAAGEFDQRHVILHRRPRQCASDRQAW